MGNGVEKGSIGIKERRLGSNERMRICKIAILLYVRFSPKNIYVLYTFLYTPRVWIRIRKLVLFLLSFYRTWPLCYSFNFYLKTSFKTNTFLIFLKDF